jgi:hypothetical protein
MRVSRGRRTLLDPLVGAEELFHIWRASTLEYWLAFLNLGGPKTEGHKKHQTALSSTFSWAFLPV